MEKEKKFLEVLIKEAGSLLLENFGRPELMKMRGSVKEVITEFDKSVDEFIRKEIGREYPKHNLLTEEGRVDKKSDWTWVIDSLDGTACFASGNPFFAVSIALMKKDKPVVGSIYAPALGEFYLAERGKGAFLNGKKISVSETGELGKSYMVSCEGGEKDRKKSLTVVDIFYPNVLDFRKLGSAAIESAWVALGRADAYVTIKIEPWDVAPGVLLVEEAGGKVTNFSGGPWKPVQDNLVFSNGKIHGQVLEKVKSWN